MLTAMLLIAAIPVVAFVVMQYRTNRKIMTALSDLAGVLNAATTKLQSVDEKVKALVAAAQNVNLTPEAQTALDALQAELSTTASDAGVDAPTSSPAPGA